MRGVFAAFSVVFILVALASLPMGPDNLAGEASGNSSGTSDAVMMYGYTYSTYTHTGSAGDPTTTPHPGECAEGWVSWVEAVASPGSLRGGGTLYACKEDTLVFSLRFKFVVESNASYFDVTIYAKEGPLVLSERPLGLIIVFDSGYQLVLQGPEGGNVSIEKGGRYEASWEAPGLPEGLSFRDITGVIVWSEALLDGSKLQPQASGSVEYYEPTCRVIIMITLNRTQTEVQMPSDVDSMILWRSYQNEAFSVMISQMGDYALLRYYINAGESSIAGVAALFKSILEWMASRGLINGLSLEDAEELGILVEAVVQKFCEPWGENSVYIYWNGTSWVYSPEQVPPPEYPTPATTATTTAVTTVATSSTTSPSRAENSWGIRQLEYASTTAGLRTPSEESFSPLSGQAEVLGPRSTSKLPLIAGILAGVLAASAAWILVRRL